NDSCSASWSGQPAYTLSTASTARRALNTLYNNARALEPTSQRMSVDNIRPFVQRTAQAGCLQSHTATHPLIADILRSIRRPLGGIWSIRLRSEEQIRQASQVLVMQRFRSAVHLVVLRRVGLRHGLHVLGSFLPVQDGSRSAILLSRLRVGHLEVHL